MGKNINPLLERDRLALIWLSLNTLKQHRLPQDRMSAWKGSGLGMERTSILKKIMYEIDMIFLDTGADVV